ncbi:MAG: marine proteobacterial sortase target protein [Granulosicoccus sp.]|nr:marine proteobacterial sortase target protein [Granulosicoccus sp.]
MTALFFTAMGAVLRKPPSLKAQSDRQRPCRRILPTQLIALCLVNMMIFHTTVMADETPAESDTPALSLTEPDFDKVSTGTLYLQHNATYLDAPLLTSSVQMSINGIVARVTMEQSFSNDGSHWVEGTYVFPLPDNAAVNSLQIRVGERVINGRIAEKHAAEKIYQTARDAGQISSLVRQERPNLFTSRIANIPPGESISTILTYTQTIDYRLDRFSLTFPMTLTPRYTNAETDPADAVAITPPQGYPDQITGPTTDLEVAFWNDSAQAPSISMISSPSHELTMSENERLTTLATPGVVPMDRDFVLQWSPSMGITPSVNTWQERVADRDYLLAMVVPPQMDSSPPDLNRELILVIDTSGSMAGQSMDAAKQALQIALDGLRESDRFNIVAFDSSTRRLYSSSRPANSGNIEQAHRYIASLQADGGTEMSPALRQALANPVEGYLRQVVFITDGSVSNEQALFAQIQQQLRSARLFTVGIGSAPNNWFMRKAAEAGRGTFITIASSAVAQEKMSSLFRQIESPALTDLNITWLGGPADVAPSPLHDLYLGEPLIFSAQLGEATTGFKLTGNLGQTPWEQTLNLDDTPTTGTGLSSVWARQKITSLLEQQRYSEDAETFKPLVTRIALEHQLLSPYTSFVAVDETVVRHENEQLTAGRVPNLMPAGSQMQSVIIPQGAAGIDTLWLFSALCGALSWLSFRLCRREQV